MDAVDGHAILFDDPERVSVANPMAARADSRARIAGPTRATAARWYSKRSSGPGSFYYSSVWIEQSNYVNNNYLPSLNLLKIIILFSTELIQLLHLPIRIWILPHLQDRFQDYQLLRPVSHCLATLCHSFSNNPGNNNN